MLECETSVILASVELGAQSKVLFGDISLNSAQRNLFWEAQIT